MPKGFRIELCKKLCSQFEMIFSVLKAFSGKTHIFYTPKKILPRGFKKMDIYKCPFFQSEVISFLRFLVSSIVKLFKL